MLASRDAVLQQQLEKILLEEQHHSPPLHLSLLIGLDMAVVVLGLARNTVPCGSWQQWLLVVAIVAPVAAILVVIRRRLLRMADIKHRAGVDAMPGGSRLTWCAHSAGHCWAAML